MLEQGQGHGDGQWTLAHAGVRGHVEKANTAATLASQMFHPNSTRTKK